MFLGSTKYWLIATIHIQLSNAATGSVGFRIGLSLWTADVGGIQQNEDGSSFACETVIWIIIFRRKCTDIHRVSVDERLGEVA
jgi:hypothetical protein